MSIIVEKITDNSILNEAFNIRKQVFVIEQKVDEREEYEFEDISTHFIAKIGDEYAGTARWRKTENGVKLERFAVLEKFRSSGVGSALLQAVIADIPSEHTNLYLHAQLTVMGLYAKYGFIETGPMFEEAGIKHFKMVLRR